MITITVLLFTILGAFATGLFKFFIVLGGVALEILLAMIVFEAIGLWMHDGTCYRFPYFKIIQEDIK